MSHAQFRHPTVETSSAPRTRHPLKRLAALTGGFALTAASLVVVTGATAPTAAAGPPVVRGTTATVQYVTGPPMPDGSMAQSFADVQNSTFWTQHSPAMAGTRPPAVVALAGDDVTWYSGVAAFTQEPNPAVRTAWAPLSSAWLTEIIPPTPWASVTMGDWGPQCQPDTPFITDADPATAIAETVQNAYCTGPGRTGVGTYKVTATNVQPKSCTNYNDYYGWKAAPAFWVQQGTTAVQVDQAVPGATQLYGGPGGADIWRPGVTGSDQSQLYVVDPQLQVIKEVCSTGTGCDPAADPPQYTQPDANGCFSGFQYQDNGGQWVKSQLIPVGTPQVQWRITAVNTGNIKLSDIHVATDTLTPGNAADAGVASDISCGNVTFAPLNPGAAASTTCLTALSGNLHEPLTNSVNLNARFTDSLGGDILPYYANDPANNPAPLIDRFTGNPTPANPTGEPSMVPSGDDSAQVLMQIPAIAVTKWVCEPDGNPGTTPDTSLDTTCADPGTDPTLMAALAAGTPTGGWAKAANVPYSTNALWAMVVTNTGETWLNNVTLTDQLGAGGGHGALSGPCVDDPDVGLLAPGASAARMCQTADMTNGNPITVTDTTPDAAAPTFACAGQASCPASAQPVINMVNVTGQPVQTSVTDGSLVTDTGQPGGQPVPVKGADGHDLPPSQWPTDRDWAQAQALPFHPSIDTEKFDTQPNADGTTDDATTGDFDAAPGRGLAAAAATPITITVTNNGDEPLKKIEVSDAGWTGPDGPTVFGLTCDFSALGGPATGTTWEPDGTTAHPYFQPNASFTCKGTVPGLPAGAAHSDDVKVTAEGVFSGGKPTDHDLWNGFSPLAAVSLTKWVCDTPLQDPTSATACAVPSGSVLASLAAGTPAGHWIKKEQTPYNQGVIWAVVVTNTGQTNLADVTLNQEDLAAGGDGHGPLAGDCLVGTNLSVLRSTAGLTPGSSLATTCTTDGITNSEAFDSGHDVINTAQATAKPVYPVYGDFDVNGNGVIDTNETNVALTPAGQTVGQPVQAGAGVLPPVLSNKDTAQAKTVIPNTAVTIIKYDRIGSDGRPVNDVYPGDFNVAPGKVLAENVATPIGFTITNTGDENLVHLSVSDATTTGPALTNLSCDFSPLGGPAQGLTWDGPFKPLDSIQCTATLPGMPLGGVHADTVTVTASGQQTGKEVTDNDDWNGHVPQPAIDLTKWVCDHGTGCAVPANDSATAKSLAAGTPAGGWVESVTVSYGAPAQWLVVVANTGNTVLTNVTLTQEGVTGAAPTRAGATQTAPVAFTAADGTAYQCAQGSNLGRMEPKALAVLSCQTLEVTSTAALRSGDDVVNTAAARGTPADTDGQPIMIHQNDAHDTHVPWPAVDTGPDSADANTRLPKTEIVVDKHDTLGGDGTRQPDGTYPGAYDDAPGLVVEPGTPTPITFTVTNTGTEDLVAISVTDATLTGPAMTDITCDFSALGGPATGTTWDGPFHPQASFDCTGVVPAMAAGDAHSDRVTVNGQGAWTGKPAESHNDWHGYVPNPKLDLTKWVCQQGTGCATPTGADLASLQAGAPAGGWVKATTVSYRTNAQWLLVVTNTGDTTLANVTLSREDLMAGGDGHGTTGPECAVNTNLGTLASKAVTTVTCTTAAITNAAGLGTGKDVINTARATGTPVDKNGQPLVRPGGGALPNVLSPESAAEVTTVIPLTNVDVEKYDTLEGDNAVTGDYDTAPGRHLKVGEPTPITFAVTNTGTEDLIDVAVTDATTAGPAITGLTCDFSALGGPHSGTTWAGPFHPNTSFECSGTVPALKAGQAHADTVTVTGTGAATGRPATDQDDWHGQTVGAPAITIAKYDTLDGDDAVTGDFDDAPGKLLAPGVATPIRFTITNSGQDALIGIVVDDVTDAGPELTGLTCDFSKLGGPAAGTTWDGPFAVGDSFDCTATLPGLPAGTAHADTALVTATGQGSGQEVSDRDRWNGHAPKASLDLTKWVCQLSAACPAPNDTALAQLASGFPAGGWVKATSVKQHASAQWLLVLTNTGDTVLTDVTLTREDLAAGGGGHGATSAECAVGTNLGRLDPGSSVTLTCKTADITNTAALGSGKDVVNTAQAKGTPADKNGQPLIIGHTRTPDVTSPPDSAEAGTTVPPPPPPAKPGKPLPNTGASVTSGLLVGGLALVVIGGALIVVTVRSRRRREV